VALLLETLVQTPAFVDFTRRSGISSKLTRTQLSGTPSAYNGDGILLNGGQGTASGGSTAGGAGGNQVIVKVAGGIYISYDLAIGLGVGLGTFFLCSCAAACAIINRKKIRRYLSSAEEREEARDKMQESAQVSPNVLSHEEAHLLTICTSSGYRNFYSSSHRHPVPFFIDGWHQILPLKTFALCSLFHRLISSHPPSRVVYTLCRIYQIKSNQIDDSCIESTILIPPSDAQNVGGSLLSFLGSRPKEGQSDKVKSTAEIVAQKTREEVANPLTPDPKPGERGGQTTPDLGSVVDNNPGSRICCR
jgi:hypothetical protein